MPTLLNSEHSMVLYLRLYLYFRFFPIAGTPGAIPWPNERSVEVLKDRTAARVAPALPSRRLTAAVPHDDRIARFAPAAPAQTIRATSCHALTAPAPVYRAAPAMSSSTPPFSPISRAIDLRLSPSPE